MSQPMYHAVHETAEVCFQCREPLVRLVPPLQGWTYYCATCQAMTTTLADFDRLADEPAEPGQIGRVVAWPLKEPLRWAK